MYLKIKKVKVYHFWTGAGTRCGRYGDININHEHYTLTESATEEGTLCKRCLYCSENKGFYSSHSWRSIRYKKLLNEKGRCQCCGRSPKKHGVVIHVDHIKPRSKFPELELDENNLQLLCEDCNFGKSNTDETSWI